MNTSQPTRSTMPPTTSPRVGILHTRLSPCYPSTHSRQPHAECCSYPWALPYGLRSPTQALQISSTTRRKLVDTIRLRHSECMRVSYAPSGCATTFCRRNSIITPLQKRPSPVNFSSSSSAPYSSGELYKSRVVLYSRVRADRTSVV